LTLISNYDTMVIERNKLNPDSNIPGVMIMGFKELAWDAWQAGKQIGLKGRNKKDEEISNKIFAYCVNNL